MAKGKFRAQAEEMGFALSMLQNSAIKKAMAAGVNAAGLATRHDSSNASVHWVAVPDGTKPRSPWRTMRDLRAHKGRGRAKRGRRPARIPVVGAKGSNHDVNVEGRTKAVKYLVARERKEVLDKYVVGRLDPVRKFYFYNSIESGVFGKKGEEGAYDDYSDNAQLEEAGNAAVAAALKAAEEAFTAGFARSKFKK